MQNTKEIELDCSKNCKHVIKNCEANGKRLNECENRYNQCVSNCAYA